MSRYNKILYWVFALLFGLSVLLGALVYLLQYDKMVGEFLVLGYPAYLVVVLAVLKLLGLVAFFQNTYPKLKTWAYAGFTFNLVLAFLAHVMVMDNEIMNPIIVLVFMILTYYFEIRKSPLAHE